MTTTNTRVCELPECGVDISLMRRGTRFCSRSCAAKARYQPTGRPPGRTPQGEHPKPASWLRAGRRVQAREEAEIRASLPKLPPEPDPHDQWRNPKRYHEMLEAHRQAKQALIRQQLESGEIPDNAMNRWQAGLITFMEYEEQSRQESQKWHEESLKELIAKYGPEGPGPGARLEDQLIWDEVRPMTEEERREEYQREQLEAYFDRKEVKRAKRAGRGIGSVSLSAQRFWDSTDA
jgi:hypothetical protein